MTQAANLRIPADPRRIKADEVALNMKKRGFWRAFADFFILFSGISTKSNVARTRNAPVVGRGLFLFRKSKTNR